MVRKLTLAEGESYELAHEVLVEKVWQWVTEEEARFKYARDMLRQDLNNYRNLSILMPLERLEIVNLYRDEMSLSEEELELLFRSALAAGYEVEYWRDRANQARLLEQLEDEWLSKLEDEVTIAEAIVALGSIGTPRLVEQLVHKVETDFAEGAVRDVLHLTTARQRRAVAALSKWTNSLLFSPYPYKAEDGREDLEAEGGRRVLRGGSFDLNEDEARCSYRYSGIPDSDWGDVGARVCVAVH